MKPSSLMQLVSMFGILTFIAAAPLAFAQSDTISNGMDDSVTPSKIRRFRATPTGEQRVNAASQSSGKTTEVLVLTSCTTVPPTSLSGRRTLGLQNCGPNDITCFLAISCGAAATGISVPAKASGICGFFAMDISANIPVSCIASTAPQLTTAATIAIELGP